MRSGEADREYRPMSDLTFCYFVARKRSRFVASLVCAHVLVVISFQHSLGHFSLVVGTNQDPGIVMEEKEAA